MSSTLIKDIIKNSKNPQFIEEVFLFAKEKYQGRERFSGEDYINHATKVTAILHEMNMDETTLAAALLHDVADTKDLKTKEAILNEVREKFGKDISYIVDRVSNLSKVYFALAADVKEKRILTSQKAENLRKMFFAISGDLRVIIIELASRVDGLNQLHHLPPAVQKIYAIETLKIFVPIANRLGLGEMKTKLEDLSFSILYPEKFTWLKETIKEKYETRQRYLKRLIPRLKRKLHMEKITFTEIYSRSKSYWSTYQKLQTHDMDFDQIHDLVALRIIVPNIEACYKTLGIIHKHFKPISEEINDYIAKPKTNGYKSLHTTVFLEKDKISEIQIRTPKMQLEAEYGICAHWSYKEGVNLQKTGSGFNWTREIPDLLKTFNINFFENEIFVFTPKGDVIVLPKGSCSIDFAYAIHSDIGNRCESAKIDGKIIPLSQVLESGDIVEIITNKKRTPSHDWLKFVTTSFAKGHIKKYTISNIKSSIFSIPSYISNKIYEIREKVRKRNKEKGQVKKEKPSQIYLAGQKGIMVTKAKCCNPKSSDQTKAYLTKRRAAVLHTVDCQNLQKLSKVFPEKIIDVSWD